MGATDYALYRGKCKEMAEDAAKADATLRLVRGWYHCPIWGKQAHWWCEKPDGTVVDPTVKQFPTVGAGATYEEFDGTIECEYCGKTLPIEDAYKEGHHVYCSYTCYGHDVGF